MLLPIFVLCLSHFVLVSPVQTEYDVEDVVQLKHHFNNFKVKYNKSYTPEEEELRLSNFKVNLEEIIELRKRNPFARFDIHQYADRSPEEKEHLACFNIRHHGGKIGNELGRCTRGSPVPHNTTILPDHLDYREMNAVTPVQRQGKFCGSSWAFSATGAVEGANALKNGRLVKLSEQQLVDCDEESNGCNGGYAHFGLSTLIEEGGQELASDYPYNAEDNECAFDTTKVEVRVLGCEVYQSIREDSLQMLLLNKGPLAIEICDYGFCGYKGGIITDCNYHIMNHAALLVGYGEENGIPYWLMKNSFGEHWGEEGYLRVQRGRRCLGINELVCSVTVE